MTAGSDRSPPAGGPVTASERIVVLDILRGFALFGILLVNFNRDYFATPVGTADRLTQSAIRFLAEGSFYPLFSFLFGVGFSLQVTRLAAKGTSVTRLYARRLGALFCFGALHAILLWRGDVLRYYALLGFPLLLLRRLPSKVLLAAVAVLLLLAIKPDMVTALMPGHRTTSALASGNPAATASDRSALDLAEHQAIRAGSYVDLVRVRTRIFTDQAGQSLVNSFDLQILAMFLLGLIAGRGSLPRGARPFAQPFGRLMVMGLAAGLAGNYLVVIDAAMRVRGVSLIPAAVSRYGGVWQVVGDVGLSLFYGTAVALLVARGGRAGRWLAPLGQVGRMALSNYLLQSLVLLVVMCGFGLGKAYQFGLAASVPLKTALFGMQVMWSGWWLRRFRFGPAEWLWRAVTYRTVPAIRRGSAQ